MALALLAALLVQQDPKIESVERVTGEVHHVDSGYHVIGMKLEDAPDISTV